MSTRARRQQLLERLRRDEAFRQSFIDEIHLLGMIKVVQSTEPRWLRLQDELGWGAGQSAAEEACEEAFMERLRGIAIHPSRRLRRFGAFGLAAAILLGGLAVSLWWMGPRPGAEMKKAAPEPPATATAALNPEPGLALVVRLEAILWETGEHLVPGEGSILMPGDRFRLRAGRVSLSFFSGVTLTLEGPADLELFAMDRVFCHVGAAPRPGSARGRRVRRRFPGLGRGRPRDRVRLERRARRHRPGHGLRRYGRGGAARRGGFSHADPARRAEQGLRARPPRRPHRRAVARPEGFVTAPDRPVAALALDPDYAAAVLASRPRGYWRFETLEGALSRTRSPAVRRFASPDPSPSAAGRLGRLADERMRRVPGRRPGAASLHRRRLAAAQSPGHAVELWFLSDGISYASLVGLYPAQGSP